MTVAMVLEVGWGHTNYIRVRFLCMLALGIIMGAGASLEQGSTPHAIFYYCVLAKQGESLVLHFDHVLDMVAN